MVSASDSVDVHTSGAITPAIRLENMVWVKPCIDDTVPRRCGNWSISTMVIDGADSDIPVEYSASGGTLLHTDGGSSHADSTLSAAAPNIRP
ncbi:hypothetical protein D3C85_1479200 [compost metagenome]